jgi:hypothetical protein
VPRCAAALPVPWRRVAFLRASFGQQVGRAARRALSLFSDPAQLRWWTEVGFVLGFYFAYEAISDKTAGARSVAFAHARGEIAAERFLGVYHERAVQQLFLHTTWVIKASDLYYVTIHFIMPVATLLWLFFRARPHYLRWRNALAWITGISLIWFMVDPVMPPRLLPPSYGFVDTLNVIGGAGRFDAALMKNAGNLYAAMPSLHLAWAAWCACALVPLVRRGWVKALLVADPLVTIFVVVVTANHFFLDLVGGAAVLGLGVALSGLGREKISRWLAFLARPFRASGPAPVPPAPAVATSSQVPVSDADLEAANAAALSRPAGPAQAGGG